MLTKIEVYIIKKLFAVKVTERIRKKGISLKR